MDVHSVSRAIREVLKNEEDVVAAYLYGSTARGTRRPDSDLDLGILVGGEPPKTLAALKLGLEGRLEDRLGLPVQLVVLNFAPPDLVHRVLRDGRLVIDRDPSARVRFEVGSRREYFDVLPYLRRYRRQEVRAS